MPTTNVNIKVADWDEDKDKLSNIRRIVFIDEQHVPQEMEWDEFDESSTHFLLSKNNQSIACARLSSNNQIGRMAVLSEYRHLGFGSKLLQFVLDIAKENGFNRVHLHAQVSAIPFYEKHNFVCQDDIFYEANIPHREMFKKLC